MKITSTNKPATCFMAPEPTFLSLSYFILLYKTNLKVLNTHRYLASAKKT